MDTHASFSVYHEASHLDGILAQEGDCTKETKIDYRCTGNVFRQWIISKCEVITAIFVTHVSTVLTCHSLVHLLLCQHL